MLAYELSSHLCRDCCGFCYDTYICVAGASNANDMENSYSPYNFIRHYNRGRRAYLFKLGPLQIHRRWLPPISFRSVPLASNVCMELCLP